MTFARHLRSGFGMARPAPVSDDLPWSDRTPVRAELFGVERLEQHAVTLAAAQAIAVRPRRVPPLQRRLDDNAAQLLLAYRANARELAAGRQIVPAADWLLDNYHLVEAQIREIRIDLPPGYYRLLPKLDGGPFAGYPRVFGIAWAFVAHTDSHFDPDMLRRFLTAYQTVQPLTIGELWAVAITLRIVLVENLRRLADQMTLGGIRRLEADLLADRICAPGQAHVALFAEVERRSTGPLSEVFAAQLAKRLRDRDPRTNPALGWLEERLAVQGASIDSVVRHAQERQGASNVTLRNIITSMRAISETDWSDLFESVSLVEARLRDHPGYGAMDFPSRNLYRSAVEDLARGSDLTEVAVATRAVAMALASPDPRSGDPGWHLIAAGRRAFEAEIGFHPPVRLRLSRWGIAAGLGGYGGAILGLTVVLTALSVGALMAAAAGPWAWIWALVALLPASAVAVTVIDRGVTAIVGASLLPGLELKDGVPTALRTVVAVPVLLTDAEDMRSLIERLEVHHLSGAGGDLSFALLTDGLDAPREVMPGDAALIALVDAEIAALNHRHPPGLAGPRFLHLHRARRHNPAEGVWMGWERKRGKLHEFNRLLRGARDTGYVTADGQVPQVPADVRHVITLDADTRMPRDTAARLIGKIAHPLNRPELDPAQGRVTEGYAILQPRVTPALESGHPATLFRRATSGPGGMDPYASASSDVYQDLFGEGSFTGKGIYHVDAFEAAMTGRVPENTLLSHDLLEGIFARAGLVSDVEVVEAFPDRHDVAARRQHRWTRGDWQLLPWIRRRDTPVLGRFKMLDNLRRSLVAPFTLAALALGWLMPGQGAAVATALVLGAVALPVVLPALPGLIPGRRDLHLTSHLRQSGRDLSMVAVQVFLAVTLLADAAWRMADAIGRSFWRLAVSRRHLLEWTTAAQSAGGPRPGLAREARGMAGGVVLGAGIAAGAAALAPGAVPLILPFALLWLAAPLITYRISRPQRAARGAALSPDAARDLRLIARRTWRYFETFVTAADSHLPPDNYQEDPAPLVARRTSPTNMGLYLLSAVAARDFGWAGLLRTTERIEATLAAMQALPRLRGHFFNWYGTADGRVLEPMYVSSVDSGNLAGHLIALANACEGWAADPEPGDVRAGLLDTLHLARLAAEGAEASGLLDDLEAGITLPGDPAWPALLRLAAKAEAALPPGERTDLRNWLDALSGEIGEHARDADPEARRDLPRRLTALAAQARAMALEMDFGFLLDPDRKLLSIGYSVAQNALDPGCYDLLASEARLASLFAIAKGDAPARHWFRLGRTAMPCPGGAMLVSWSGSMFEYLMPALVMAEPEDSLLAQTDRLVVARQQAYGRKRGVPWGVSESGFNARDIELNYQYSTFGIPGLGLKRGLAADLVIAPYATGLAAMIDPAAARRNYAALAALGGLGRFGFVEALDFTPTRVPDGETVAVVRSYMAHHQGMTIVAIANALQDGRMRARFHAEPMIRAAELLLQERIPRDIVNASPRAEGITAPVIPSAVDMQRMVLIEGVPQGPPVTHILSNGRYSVMLTARGGGYSRWDGIAVTRWQADATRDTGGTRFWLRDLREGVLHPVPGADTDHGEVQFFEDRATFTRRDGALSTMLDVLVSGEDDAEVRRISVTSTSRRAREVEITSFAELVLTTPATDEAHPAFAKMFVQTEYLPEFGALIATRRRRGPDEPGIWAAHFLVVEGEPSAPMEYETDRAAFLGRDNDVTTARALAPGMRLTDSVGTVLDPVFALRQRMRIAPGGVARLAFWTVVAPTREELLDLIDRHHDRSAFDRAKTLAWTQAQVQLRHLGVDAARAAEFQRLAAPLLYPDARFRAGRGAIAHGAGKQSGLWPLAISGDLPIVLLRIDDQADMAQVQELLLAQEYWRMKRLDVDLVVLNEHPSSYVQSLQTGIEAAVRSGRAGEGEDRGTVHALRADLMQPQTRALLVASARVVLMARRGPLEGQITAMLAAETDRSPPPFAAGAWRQHVSATPEPPAPPRLEFFNGTGGFDRDGREYVTILEPGTSTPAPWVNVIANDGFGFHVSASGSASTWAENSRDNRLTPWSNDPVADPTGEAFYIRDEMTGEVFSPTARPLRRRGRHVARHGFGYSRFEHEAGEIAFDLLQYVPLDDPVKISRLTLRNLSGRRRRLTVLSYAEPVMGPSRAASAPFVITERDAETGAIFARNPWNMAFPDRVMFSDMRGLQTGFTTDRTGFLGHGGDLSAPFALTSGLAAEGEAGAGLDPCMVLARSVTLAPGAGIEVVHFLGQTASAGAARALIARLRVADLDRIFADVGAHWREVLGTVQVETPDRAMDIMLNGWLQYQTLACRVQARAGFYQASGAYGFRDQLQDGMALTLATPGRVRAHLLRAAGRQFPEGDVQHWWLPHSGQGVRTRISDDCVWLGFAVADYVAATGDAAVLDEPAPFLEGPPLAPGQHDAFFLPDPSGREAPLFEHCARGLDRCLALTGPLGLPLIGTGDWNDGMNRVGEGGRGESVWLGWLLLRTLALFAPLAETRDPARAARWRAQAGDLRAALEREAWDGAWYRRATFDDSTWLGTAAGKACRIDSIPQSWAVLSGQADPARAAQAMRSMTRELIRPEPGIALLFTPAFDNAAPEFGPDPGYIAGYPPGLRENGGQYSHAAMWAILARTRMGDGDGAARLFAMLNPINHALTPAAVRRYKVEPFVVAADVYSVAPHAGRGGWTWYTGSAAWMYRAGVEGILGLRREGGHLRVDPCLPGGWPGFSARLRVEGTRIDIRVTQVAEGPRILLDGAERGGEDARVPLDGGAHVLRLRLPPGKIVGNRHDP
ncbi:GH36-type glycosyl hydrolase domain-containing protein [Paenirhodobacter populi]|uniref:Glycosyl transferase n=1 Tax=Paenirhodobacter populi TaxID=2306993 RepID=A0A443JLE6_9RHOB|nr:glucoamylase family protein [Sinirhodobacter populi]RWR21405.1 glycosyl transferase [Sinirhodobacter populi]